MASSSPFAAKACPAWSAADRSSQSAQCDSVSRSHRLSVAIIAGRLSQMEDGLHGVLALAKIWAVGSSSRCAPQASATQRWQTEHSGGDDHRQPIDPHRRRGRRTWLRCGRKDHRSQASLGRRYFGTGVGHCGAGSVLARQDGACFVLMKLRQLTRLRVVFADSAYSRNGLPGWVQETFGWILQTVLRPVQAKGFVVLPKRWIVERTFAWLAPYRRHARDYERNPETAKP